MALQESQRVERIPPLDIKTVRYSDRYSDDVYEYRHVILPKDFAKYVPRTHLLSESEWRNLGIQQSPGWVHYMLHAPEPHVLMFRRLLADAMPATQRTRTADETVEKENN